MAAPSEPERRPLDDESRAAAKRRTQDVPGYANAAIEDAIRRGEFENLPGFGKPLQGLGAEHDPDWWLKKLVQREQIVVLPASVQLRKDDAELDELLDQQATEAAARELVEDFNARVLKARYGAPVGPPLITMPRDVDETLAAWRARRTPSR
jgi:Domain of unknown function (DUF1992)